MSNAVEPERVAAIVAQAFFDDEERLRQTAEAIEALQNEGIEAKADGYSLYVGEKEIRLPDELDDPASYAEFVSNALHSGAS